MQSKIGLSEMVAALRQELAMAQTQAKGESLRFTVEDIELELQIATEKSDKVVSGVKFWVVNSSLDLEDKTVRTQKLRLKLKVTDYEDGPGKPPEIAGEVSG